MCGPRLQLLDGEGIRMSVERSMISNRMNGLNDL
jgi:hypothetical protein